MSEHKMDELLAWYANGTLDDAEQRQVEAWLDNNPEAQLALAEHEFIQHSVAEVGAEEPVFNAEAGFGKLMAQIETEEAANEIDIQPAPVSLAEQLRNWIAQTFAWHRTPAFARVAMVSQLGIVLALGVVVMLPNEQAEDYQVLSGTPPAMLASGPQADIGVDPKTYIGQFQTLLRQQDAKIVSGPTAIGTYRIQFPDDAQLEARMAALKANQAVIYLQRVAP
ncbi:MAG: hypothetical protein V7752_01665 [Halopseudomonas sp.]